jgi:hypothetical protein
MGGQRHATAALPAGKRVATRCIGGWLGPRAGLDGCGKSRPHRDSIPVPSRPWWVAIPTELSRPTDVNTKILQKEDITGYNLMDRRL